MTGLAPAAILWMLTLLGVYAAVTAPRDDDQPEPPALVECDEDDPWVYVNRRGYWCEPGQEPREVGAP